MTNSRNLFIESFNRKKQITLKTISLQFFAIFIIAAAFTACGSSDNGNGNRPGFPGQQGPPRSVEAITVTPSSISEQIRSFGTIQAQDVVNINPQVSNRITRIHVDLGDTVQQGQIMAKIYDVPFRDALEQAQAQLRQAQINFERDSTQYVRQESLFQSNAISALEFDNARATFQNSRAQLESARASLTQSRENLSNTEIRSPVYGVVLNRSIAEGDIASTGQVAFEVANLIGFETRLFLPYYDWDRARVGLPVEFRISNTSSISARGVISRISPQLNPSSGLGEVVVSLTEVLPAVRQGMLMETKITLRTNENTIVIPRAPLVERVETYIEPETNTIQLRRTYSVFVTRGDTVAVRRDLTLGLEQGDRVEVLSGLNEGDRLIVTGNRNLNNNSRIRLAQQAPPRDTTIQDGPGQRPGQGGGQGQRPEGRN